MRVRTQNSTGTQIRVDQSFDSARVEETKRDLNGLDFTNLTALDDLADYTTVLIYYHIIKDE